MGVIDLRSTALSYLNAKAAWSQTNDRLMFWAPRARLPRLGTLAEVWLYAQGKYTWRPDPVRGMGDYYIHHDREQARLAHGRVAVPWQGNDCDKLASWAYAVGRSIPGVGAQLLTLVCPFDASRPLDKSNWGHHTIAGFTQGGRSFVLDVNGFQEVPSLDEAHLCPLFTGIYRGQWRYDLVVRDPYPW